MRQCQTCGGPSRVYDTRETSVTVRRSRECRMCGARWTTMEITHQDWVLYSRAFEAIASVQAPPTNDRRTAPFGTRRLTTLKPKPGSKPAGDA